MITRNVKEVEAERFIPPVISVMGEDRWVLETASVFTAFSAAMEDGGGGESCGT